MTQVLLIGYSRGADVLPFLVNRLPEAARAALRLVALLGPGRTIDFEFQLADYVRDSKAATALPVPPEILKLRGQPLLIVYGEDDDSSCAPQLPKDIGHIECLPGDHHFARAYGRLAEIILKSLRGAPARAVAHPEDSMKP